jgi:D-glycero-alpha-D-manno-heptose-7-phosphate kinase
VIKVPAGYQDYYSAQYGGVACIHFRPDGIEREELNIDTKTLEERIVVIYTGEPRNSGINNWEITKRHIDGDKELSEIFDGIRDGSLQLREALLENDWTKAGEILSEGYPLRKRLSPNITTPWMDEIIEKAESNGAIAAKICGAGGGGCVAFFCEEGRKTEVENILNAEQNIEVLDWKISNDGLVIKTS